MVRRSREINEEVDGYNVRGEDLQNLFINKGVKSLIFFKVIIFTYL